MLSRRNRVGQRNPIPEVIAFTGNLSARGPHLLLTSARAPLRLQSAPLPISNGAFITEEDGLGRGGTGTAEFRDARGLTELPLSSITAPNACKRGPGPPSLLFLHDAPKTR